MKLTVTGATGLIGRRLVQRALADGHAVHQLVRQPKPGLTAYSIWDLIDNQPPPEAIDGADAVVHLAGEPVAQRWTEELKKRILKSRVTGTQRLVQAISVARRRPRTLLCASAIGYYGSRGDEVLTESSSAGSGFLADVCDQWEQAAALAAALGLRVVQLRIGLVLSREGGVLGRMLLPFRAGLGGCLGAGTQWMSWIHLDDLVSLILTAAADERYQGPVNGVSPEPVVNSEFAAVLGRTLHRPVMLSVPEWALRLVYGETAQTILASQRVLPEAALNQGFAFTYPSLGPALAQILGPGVRSSTAGSPPRSGSR